jgi:pyridoxal phosphate enzyme (YggS family)
MDYAEIKKFCDVKGIDLVAISKTKTLSEILAVYNQGQRIFGENKAQELVDKAQTLPKDIQWHLVGHLQTNKVKYIVQLVSLIHSIDSWKLLEEVNKQSAKLNCVVDVLLQIHIAKEETKFGLSYEEAKMILLNPELEQLMNVRIRGLMGMATLTEDEEQVRKEFRELKNFFEEMKLQISKFTLQTLSMGMSSDYKIAVEEGSTMVRVGSAIFGERNYEK